MDVNDRVYGGQKIEEIVLIEIINSPEMQRLKRISQFGMPDEYYHKKGFSRYEHSLGVFFLVRMLKGGLEEQIAGLSHDVSHTAFSHVVDWALGDPSKEDYQDNRHLKFIKNSSLASIFRQNGFSAENIANLHSFHLVDYPAPDLCADRIDYTLREMALESKALKDIELILHSLIVSNGKIIFNSENSAFIFSDYYAKFNREHWANTEAKTRYHILAGILKTALSEKILSIKDIEDKDDYGILKVLECCENSFILEELDFLKKGFKVEKNTGPVSFLLRKKFRYVDPMVLYGSKILRLSKIREDYKRTLESDREKSLNEERIAIAR